jgi:uncharacterized repeat protein (TIGR03803 family)
MKKFVVASCLGLLLLGIAPALTAQSATSSTFYPFAGGTKDGDGPTMLIQALDGNFYGITSLGGGGGANCINDSVGCGTIFEISAAGKETVVHSFTGGADGGIPSSIIQGPDGNIYVTTIIGGPDSASSNPTSTVLNICTDSDGNADAAPCCVNGQSPATCGGIFEFTPAQASPVTLNPLYTFTGGTDGASPGTLILGATASQSEVIFGTTLACSNCSFDASNNDDYAGANIYGTVFSFVPKGSTAETPSTIVTFPLTFSPVNFTLSYPNSLIQSGPDTLYGTTQMGGDTNITSSSAPTPTTPCPANSNGGFGCGGVFEVGIAEKTVAELCDFGDSTCFASATVAGEPVTLSGDSRERAKPEVVVTQSGARFPVGGDQWNFSPAPIALTMDSGGSVYGTTPPGCANGGTYIPNPTCSGTDPNGDPAFEVSSIFKFTPPKTSGTAGTLDTLYSFTGTNDGGGTEAGLIYAADGNFYGASGIDSGSSEVFATTSSGVTSYAALGSTDTPTWLIQGSDGNLYGTSTTGGTGFGAVFQVKPSTPLPLPVQLSFADSTITVGSEATLTWKVPNAFSISSQQCFPYVEANQTGAGTWSAPGTASTNDGVYSNSATITPTKAGTFNYAVTCGGTVSGYISLTVNSVALSISPMSLAATTAETPYSETLTASGGSGTGYAFSITAGAASLTALGLSLSPAGVISGTPTAGTASFTLQLTDSASDTPASQAYTLTVNKAPATVTLGGLSATYTGSPIAATATTSPTGLSVNLTYNGNSTAPTAAGSYAVFGTINDPNYQGSATGTMTIAKATATVTLGGLSATYTGSPIAATATTSPTGLSVSFTYNGNSTAPTAAGSYAVVGTINDPNYQGSATGTMTIAKATATVTLGGLSATYTGSPIAATATTSPTGLSVNLTYNGNSTAPTAAGSYAVVGTINDPNYQGSATGTLAIAKATPTVNWATPAAITDGTALSATQLDASATFNGNAVAGTFAYNPSAGTVLAAGSQTLKVTFTPTDTNDLNAATGQVTLTVNNPVSTITSTSPVYASAGGAAFTLTINGEGFLASSTANWGGTALTTTYVSATQLTAQVPASAITSAGVDSVTVTTPSPGGGTSAAWQFEVEPGGSGTGAAPTITAVTSSVNPASSASYTVTLPSGATGISVTCLNLPAGAGCSYAGSTLTIATANTTPAGTYSIVAVFTYSLPGSGSALIVVPFLLLPLLFARKKRALAGILAMLCVAVALLTLSSCGGGGGGGNNNTGPTQPTTYQATSTGVVTLTVQ